MTDLEKRRADFEAVFLSAGERNKTRVKRICEILQCSQRTVWIWRTSSERACPTAKIRILRRELLGSLE